MCHIHRDVFTLTCWHNTHLWWFVRFELHRHWRAHWEWRQHCCVLQVTSPVTYWFAVCWDHGLRLRKDRGGLLPSPKLCLSVCGASVL